MSSELFISFRGEVRGEMRDAISGSIIKTFHEHVSGDLANMVVRRSGLVLASALRGSPNRSTITHLAVGSGTVATVLTDTQLGNELGRLAPTFSFITDSTVTSFNNGTENLSNKLRVSTTFPTTFTGSLSEVGLFADGAAGANSGIMICRKTFPVWVKDNSSTITFDWDLFFPSG